MAHNVDFSDSFNIFYQLQESYSSTNNFVLRMEDVYILTKYMYDLSNNFFTGLNTIFGANVQDVLKSIRWYPFDLSSYFDIRQIASGDYTKYTMGHKTLDVIHVWSEGSTPIQLNPNFYLFDNTLNNNVVYFGHIDVPYFESTDSYLSYEPYTRLALYLPFVDNLVELDTRRVAGSLIHIHGAINFQTGDMTYIITTEGGEYITSATAHITIELPTYSTNYKDIFKQLVSAYSNGADNMNGKRHSAFSSFANKALKIATLDIPINQVTNGNYDVIGSYYKPSTPALYIYRPIVKYHLNDTNYNHAYGVPCKKIDLLREFGGFTKVDEVHIRDIAGATKEEIAEIETLLHNGIILDNTNAVFNIFTDVQHASLSNTASTIQYGWTYTCDVTAASGYQLDSIQVTMGGQDVTSTSVSGNHIEVPNVSGNLRIIVRASVIPVYHSISYTLTGATKDNPATQILTDSTYTTHITPIYANGYLYGNYEPIIQMGGVILVDKYSNGTIYITHVLDNISISGTMPQVSTMNDLWRLKSGNLTLPSEPIDLTGVSLAFEDDTTFAKTTADCIIDNQTDLNGYFINFTSGGDSYSIDTFGRVYDENDTQVATITKISFLQANDYYTNYSGLLEWLDTNSLISSI